MPQQWNEEIKLRTAENWDRRWSVCVAFQNGPLPCCVTFLQTMAIFVLDLHCVAFQSFPTSVGKNLGCDVAIEWSIQPDREWKST